MLGLAELVKVDAAGDGLLVLKAHLIAASLLGRESERAINLLSRVIKHTTGPSNLR